MWRKTGNGNELLECDDFYISYNPDTSSGPFEVFGDIMGPKPETAAETALCCDGRYLILCGDHRKAYERLAPQGYDACKAYYDGKKDLARSRWSSDFDEYRPTIN